MLNPPPDAAVELPDLSYDGVEALACRLAPLLGRGDVVALWGDLGAGKTAFARALLQVLAGREIEVPSPTFTLVQTYILSGLEIWHFDLYRLKQVDEIYELGFEDALSDGLTLIEWPERLGAALPRERLDIRFDDGTDTDHRTVTISGSLQWSSRIPNLADARSTVLEAMLARAGWAGAERRPLAGDASFRRYVRLVDGDRTAMLMDAPPPHNDAPRFVKIAERLLQAGYSAPEILEREEESGFLLLEDFGDQTFSRALQAGISERALYTAAIDLLISLHRQNAAVLTEDVPAYDERVLQTELDLFTEWYLPAVPGLTMDPDERQVYRDIWAALVPLAFLVPETLVLRDYHVDNLMVLDRLPPKSVGLLDFQDALKGSVLYDLVSLLRDARRDVDPTLVTELSQRYSNAFPAIDALNFNAAFACLSVQRNLKIIGIFTRLARRDGKAAYLKHIPRCWRMIETDCQHPAMAPVAVWLDRVIPPDYRVLPNGERL
jgi:tRNA threonylcarbamoyl adenosine modification protein YjeE